MAAAAAAGLLMCRCSAAAAAEPAPPAGPEPELEPAPVSSSSSSSRRATGAGNAAAALADGQGTVDWTQQKSTKEPQQHGVADYSQSMPPRFLEELFPRIKAAFAPHTVKYNNTNTYIKQDDAGKAGTGGTQEHVEWKVSSYLELDASLGGQMQKQVACNMQLLEVSMPMLDACDRQFSDWYRAKKGPDAIHKLVRLQSFITRYRVNPDESAGLLRHIDGVQVDGSLILALHTDSEWRGNGGGVTVWEGPEEDEVQWDYAMNPGDICFLDNYVWHQGNPITAGERWVLVIFYRTKQVKGTRFSRMFLKAAAERKRKVEAEAAAARKGGGAPVTRVVTAAEMKSS